MTDEVSRRRALALAGTAGLTLSAGCGGLLGGGDGSDGDSGGDGSGDAGDAGDGSPTTTDDGDDGFDPASVGTYRQPQYDAQNTGRSGLDGALSDPGRAWRHREAGEGPGYSMGTPAVVQDAPGADGAVAYVAEGTIVEEEGLTRVFALSVADGSVVWTHEFEGTNDVGAVSVAAGTVVVEVGGLLGLDPETGERRWRYDENVQSGLTVGPEGETGYCWTAGIDESTVRAVSLSDGRERWTTEVREGRFGVPAPAVDGDRVYAGGNDLVVLDAANGDQVQAAGLDLTVEASPTVAGDAVFVGGGRGDVAAVGTDGTVRWTGELDGSPRVRGTALLTSSPAVTDDLVVYGFKGRTTALSRTDGGTVWTADVGDYPPTIHDGVVHVADLGSIAGVDVATGDRQFRFRTDASGGSPVVPVALSDLVLFPSDGLYALADGAGS